MSPARVLDQLERTMAGLQLRAMTTAVVAVVSHEAAADGRREVRWCSAGHLPPVVRRDDGQVEVLASPPDLMLGVQEGSARSERGIWLAPGETLVMYTDGLVERRGEDIDAGLQRLCQVLVAADDAQASVGPGGQDVERLADALLAALLPEGGEDDVAVVLLRVRPPG